MESDGRRHPIHLPAIERHNTTINVFLTGCTKGRKPILADASVNQVLREAWQIQPTWLIGRYVIMPNHVHLFCAPAQSPPADLAEWVSFWKSHCSRHWPQPQESPIWQRHFWDQQLRRGESYEQKWHYVLNNPVRAGLATQAEDWPYQGELNILEW